MPTCVDGSLGAQEGVVETTMEISVILCTYNRCQSLVKALESVAVSTLPRWIEWEVLVVDNNSHDQTREVVEEFSGRYPGRFRYLFEPQPGKSHALNAGIQQARGRILAFMDDDVTVEQTWLQNLTAGLRTGEWAGAGGRILFPKNFTPPRWLGLDGPHAIASILAFFDLGLEPGELTRPPIGTNMAFQRTLFDKYGAFRTNLGPQPGNEIRGEDIEFGQRVLAADERLRYEPSAVVYHPVPENRLKKSYFLRFCFDHGRSAVRCLGPRAAIWGIPRNYFSILKMGILLLLKSAPWLLTVQPQRRFHNKLQVWLAAGVMFELCRQLLGYADTTDKQLNPDAKLTGV
jgi:glucosyl-dolichyl phosphate glucuronosyltransferase